MYLQIKVYLTSSQNINEQITNENGINMVCNGMYIMVEITIIMNLKSDVTLVAF